MIEDRLNKAKDLGLFFKETYSFFQDGNLNRNEIQQEVELIESECKSRYDRLSSIQSDNW